ncbi:hypothetical protein, partial [Janthinobacterium sp.]|uniref:hypothetical protein n=1 Tax=Janthinobacterium sp. TaxID=1871054 RepID=UPI00261D67AB
MIFLLSVIVPTAYAESICSGKGYKNDISITKNSPLRISVDLTGKKYKTTDNIALMVSLWNKSSMDIYILRKEGFYTDVSVKIKDHFTGKDLETNFVPTSLPPPPMSVKDLLKIL